MEGLLSDPSVVSAIYTNYPHIETILLQIQRDVVTPDNSKDVGDDILALKRIGDIFLLFYAKGATLKTSPKKD
jgi:hypothetical protein